MTIQLSFTSWQYDKQFSSIIVSEFFLTSTLIGIFKISLFLIWDKQNSEKLSDIIENIQSQWARI